MSELRRKRRELDEVTKFFDTEIKKARKEKKSSGEIDMLISEALGQTDRIKEEIKVLVSRSWERKAEELLLPIPSYEDSGMWGKGDLTRHWYLTPKGITNVRNLVREETAARRKAVLEWVTPLTGIIGSTTGLLAVIFAMT